jgi:DNA-binding FrmR family transcriptional regulator
MATQAILQKVNREVIKAHLSCCVKDSFVQGNEDEKIEEIIKLLEKLSK